MSFEDAVLNKESQKPADAPNGTWYAETVGSLRFSDPINFKTQKGKTGRLVQAIISVIPKQPKDDVDQDEAEEYLNAEDAVSVRWSKPIFENDDGEPSNRDLYTLDRVLESIGFTGSRAEATKDGALNGLEVVAEIGENDRGYKEVRSLTPRPEDD